jgi:hypothetical protein
VKFQTFLSAEGILMEDVVVDQNLLAFEDALFCIHLQRQYSASNELDTFLQTYFQGDKSTEDPNSLKYVQALQVSIKQSLRLSYSPLLLRSEAETAKIN